jgi:hypothetical protein
MGREIKGPDHGKVTLETLYARFAESKDPQHRQKLHQKPGKLVHSNLLPGWEIEMKNPGGGALVRHFFEPVSSHFPRFLKVRLLVLFHFTGFFLEN